MELGGKRIDHPYLDVFAVILAIVLVAGAGFWYKSYSAAEAARTEQAAKLKQRRAAIEAFDELMESRGSFLTLNAQVDGTLGQVKTKIENNLADQKKWDEDFASRKAAYESEIAAVKAHNDAEDAKYKADPRYTNRDYWSYPSYPTPPPPISVDFTTEINSLTAQSTALTEFIKELKKNANMFKYASTSAMHKDLLASAEAVRDAVERDVKILGNILTTAEEGAIVNEAKADLVKYNTGDPALKSLNKKALAFIDDNGLDILDYEVPGGTDSNPADKSGIK